MRRADASQSHLFISVDMEERVPAKHPLRAVRSTAASVLGELRHRLDQAYDSGGRFAMPPEQVLRALVLWALYSVPSERQLLEQLEYNLLYRWFVGLQIEDKLWSRAAFRANRRRLQDAGVVSEFLARVFARTKGQLLANAHFTVNRSLIEALSGQTTLPGF